jgi:hypothetical protein
MPPGMRTGPSIVRLPAPTADAGSLRGPRWPGGEDGELTKPVHDAHVPSGVFPLQGKKQRPPVEGGAVSYVGVRRSELR